MPKVKIIKGRKSYSVFDVPSDKAQKLIDEGKAEYLVEGDDRQIKGTDIETGALDKGSTCKGENKDGSPCKKRVVDADFCHYHSEDE